MSVISEFRLASEDIALMRALETVPQMILDVEQTIAEDPDQPILFVWAHGDNFEEFERALSADDSIAECEVVETLREERLYRIQISSAADVGFYHLDIEVGASRLDVSATHEGVELRMRFPDQQSLQEYFDRCRAQGIAVSLHRLYHDQTGTENDNQYSLSEKQRETLELAHGEGFFEVPRRTSLAAIAEELGISEQAVSERIRRAMATLISNALAPEGSEP
jgi:predicted DNA binding protein